MGDPCWQNADFFYKKINKRDIKHCFYDWTHITIFYVNFSGQENVPCPEGWFLCECSQTCIPPNEGDDPQNPSWAVCNGKNDCCGTIHGVLSHTFPKVCADHNKANYTALDEENCQT